MLKLPLCLGRSFHRDFNTVERIVGESAFNLHSVRSYWLVWIKKKYIYVAMHKQSQTCTSKTLR